MKNFTISKTITNREDIALNCYLKDISRYPVLSLEEEVELAARARGGDESAKERLAKCNLRFVVTVAKQYQGMGVGLMDLIAEGNIGLLKAVDRFDETRGFRFVSYAVNWIRQAIFNAISSQSRVVRLPVNKVAEIQKIKKASFALEQQLGRVPTLEELSDNTGIPEYKINELQWLNSHSMSLDASVGPDSDTCLGDFIAVENYERTDGALLRESLATDLRLVLDKLSEVENLVLRLLYGFDGARELTLDEVGETIGVSRERVRQISVNAMRKLRKMGEIGFLQQYLAA